MLDLKDKTLGEHTEAYNRAVDALEQSMADLRKAEKELADVAAAINKVA